jgi:hypothetical protein
MREQDQNGPALFLWAKNVVSSQVLAVTVHPTGK